MSTWVLTASGLEVDLFDPQPDQIHIGDIALALSRIVRFNGHTRFRLTVAQHSILVAQLLPDAIKLEGLLHDAHEAYVGDLVSPLVAAMDAVDPGASFALSVIKQKLDAVIAERFLLCRTDAVVKYVAEKDLVALATERRDLMPTSTPWSSLAGVEPHKFPVQYVNSHNARMSFLDMFNKSRRDK